MATPTTDCCAAKVQVGPHDGGAREGTCRDCDDTVCSACAGMFEQEDGYGDDGTGIRTFALCQSCYSGREDKRQRREARHDSGV
jgi:hypothetical protein